MSVTTDQTTGRKRRRAVTLTEQEQAVVRRYSGRVAWPTVLLTLALLAVEVGTIVWWAAGVVPLAVGFMINTVVSYAFYTVHHDATHKSISGRNPKWRWLDAACGNVAGFVLQLDLRGYGANHLRHHAHTNTGADPDLMVKGPLWQVPLKWGLANVLQLIAALPHGDRLVAKLLRRLGMPVPAAESDRDRGDRARMLRLYRAGMVLLLASIPFGWFWPMFLLWWLPGRVGILILMVLFQWLPHFPFERTDRFGATRVTRFAGSTWVLIQQDRHLIHHLYPSIPWYQYRAAFRELRPFLEANHAIVQGRGTDPYVPIQLRSATSASA